jgi:pilus assembly protein CpaE
MQALLICDDSSMSARVRQVLIRSGLACPASNVVMLDLAAFHLRHAKPEMVVMVLPPDAEHGLAVLEDVRSRNRARLVLMGPSTDAKLVLRALRAGADDYMDESDFEQELGAILSKWRAERGGHDEAGKVIAVLAPSGGSGSSTLSVNLATALAKQHKETALFDMKLQTGDLASLLDLKPKHTLADLCQNLSRVDATLFERTLVHHASGVRLLASPLSISDVGYVNAEGVHLTLKLARSAYPYVVVDLDHSFREEQLTVLRQADVILMVIRLDFVALRNARRALEHLRELGVDQGRIRLVVNRYGQPKEVSAAKAEEALGMEIAFYVPEDAKTVNRSNNNGVPVVLEAPSSKISKSIVRLAAGVNGRHAEGKPSANGTGHKPSTAAENLSKWTEP